MRFASAQAVTSSTVTVARGFPARRGFTRISMSMSSALRNRSSRSWLKAGELPAHQTGDVWRRDNENVGGMLLRPLAFLDD